MIAHAFLAFLVCSLFAGSPASARVLLQDATAVATSEAIASGNGTALAEAFSSVWNDETD